MTSNAAVHQALKDPDAQHPIASAWRPTLTAVVNAFAAGDYVLAAGVRDVAPIAAATAEQIRDYIEDYGETLTALSDETWESSVAQWIGSYWDVIVDLWTVESGRSDMVLHLRAFDLEGAFRFEIHAVYVP